MHHGALVHSHRDLVVLNRVVVDIHGLDETAGHVLHDALSALPDVNDQELHVRGMDGIDTEPLGDGKVAGARGPGSLPAEDTGAEGQALQGKRGVGHISSRSGGWRQPGLEALTGGTEHFYRHRGHGGMRYVDRMGTY